MESETGCTQFDAAFREFLRAYPSFEGTRVLDDSRRCIDGKSSGAVRISVGLVTNFADVYRLMQFAESLLDLVSVQMAS